jgi:ATP-dependent Lhr-like helicase
MEPLVDLAARQLLARYGFVLRRLLERERIPVPWWRVVGSLRRMELRGEVRGGHFVAGFAGEQFALPEAIPLLRGVRKSPPASAVHVSAADPLNLRGILTPEDRVPSLARRRVPVAPR